MSKDLRAKMRALAASKSAESVPQGQPLKASETPSNVTIGRTAAASEPAAEPPQPSVLAQQAILDKANQAVSDAVSGTVSSESGKAKLPSLAGAMNRLAVSQAKAEQELAAASNAPKVEAKKLPTPKDPTLKSAAELSLIAKAKLLKETGEQYESVFPSSPWPESYIEDFDADGHLNDLKLLEQQLLTDEEILPVLMIRVHQNLKQYEELAHILSEEQIQVIVGAFAKRKNIEIVAAASGKSTSQKGRSVQAITKDLTIEQVMGML